MSRRYYETETNKRRDKEVEKMFDNMTLLIILYLLTGMTIGYYLNGRD